MPRALAVLGGVSVVFVTAVGAFGALHITDAAEMVRFQEAAVAAGTTDMMHDAIRSDVLAGLLAEDAAGIEAARADVDEHQGRMLEQLDLIGTSLDDVAEARDHTAAALPIVQAYGAAALATIDAAASDSPTVDARRAEFETQFEALEVELDALSGTVLDAGLAAQDENHDATTSARRLLWTVTVLGGISMTGVAWFITRSITKPLSACGADVAASAVQIRTGGSRLRDQAGRNSDLAQESKMTSTGIAGNVEAIATATRELTAAIGEISRSTTTASTVAQTAVSTAEETAGNIERLGASTAEIGAVVDLITSIAEQTNLLALNATIEAARAGASGKGFAIVANEVKQLAGATADATTTITDAITRLQREAGVAAQQVGEVREIIGQINDAQMSISAAIEQQTYTTSEIATAATSAASEVHSIQGQVDQVASVAHDNLETVDSTVGAGDVLGRVADRLAGLVGSR